jgi:prepilin-type processing-associated H-X9-DG protein
MNAPQMKCITRPIPCPRLCIGTSVATDAQVEPPRTSANFVEPFNRASANGSRCERRLRVHNERRDLTQQANAGVTWIDVLFCVLVTICLSSLIATTLPAIQEAARKHQCQDNLRRLGLAVQAYHDVFSTIPPASFWDDAQLILDGNMRPEREPETIVKTKANWVQLLLPFAGQEELARRFAPGVPITDQANQAARTVGLPLMTCPTDTYSVLGNPYVLATRDGRSFEFARGNYAINGGTQTNATWPGRLTFPIPDGNMLLFRSPANDFQWWGNGVAGFNHCFSFRDFSNGLSTTVLLDEIRAGIVPEDSRGAWALGQIGSSVTWAHGVNGDDSGPNNQWMDSDDILQGRAIAAKYGMQVFFDARLPFCAHCSYSNQATARSQHEGGVNVLMADGSNRFVADSVSPSLWHVMHSRETPRDVLSKVPDTALTDDKPADPAAANTQPTVGLAMNSSTSVEQLASPVVRSHEPMTRGGLLLTNSIGMQFARIPSGEFTMGLPDKDNTWPYPDWDVKPHQVRITRQFFIGVCEVAQEQFRTVTGYNPSFHKSPGHDSCAPCAQRDARLPVENVTWDEAADFCKRLSNLSAEKAARRRYRLPTEAEWEYVCRSGSSAPHPFVAGWEATESLDELAGKDKHPTKEPLVPRPVGSYPPNAFGVCDMRGNIFEWTGDWFDRTYYAHSPLNDPQGPSSGFVKVVRGWDWTFIGPQCKDYQFMTPPWMRNRYIGFRVVCESAR